MTEESNPHLIVVNGGDHTFLGICFEFDEDHGYVVLHGAFPIGRRQVMGPNGPMQIPALGTMDWCILEPVREMTIHPRWFYFPKEQSKETHEEFQKVYSGFLKDLETAKSQHAMEQANLQKATPQDLQRMEEAAKKMGLGTGPDLMQVLKDGGKLIR